MDIFQYEKIYKANGLKDNLLRSTDDLLKIYGIDYREVDGYSRLDDLNKQLYLKFIVNFYNAQGLNSRATIVPKGIYFVEDMDYMVKENPDDDYFTSAGGLILAIDKNGLKTVHWSWKNENYKHLKLIEGKVKTYLRFEYEHYGREGCWLHITDEKTWY